MDFTPPPGVNWHSHKRRASIEHLLDRHHGGSNRMSNLVLACRKCNNDRSGMPHKAKMASRGVAIKQNDHTVKFKTRTDRLYAWRTFPWEPRLPDPYTWFEPWPRMRITQ